MLRLAAALARAHVIEMRHGHSNVDAEHGDGRAQQAACDPVCHAILCQHLSTSVQMRVLHIVQRLARRHEVAVAATAHVAKEGGV